MKWNERGRFSTESLFLSSSFSFFQLRSRKYIFALQVKRNEQNRGEETVALRYMPVIGSVCHRVEIFHGRRLQRSTIGLEDKSAHMRTVSYPSVDGASVTKCSPASGARPLSFDAQRRICTLGACRTTRVMATTTELLWKWAGAGLIKSSRTNVISTIRFPLRYSPWRSSSLTWSM